jgi:hypothetical protein
MRSWTRDQPWLVFLAHRPLGYSSNDFYQQEGSFSEPMGRALQPLWQKHRVDLAVYGHVHNYEQTCPVYENICTVKGKDAHSSYSGALGGAIHVVAGTGGAKLRTYAGGAWPQWSVARNQSFGYVSSPPPTTPPCGSSSSTATTGPCTTRSTSPGTTWISWHAPSTAARLTP